jgi:hypothetical protein
VVDEVYVVESHTDVVGWEVRGVYATLGSAVSSVPDAAGFKRVGVRDWEGDRVAGVQYWITRWEVPRD